MKTAKLFRMGESQAVRLPEGFEFEGEAVQIRREGKKVILEPLDGRKDLQEWPEGFWDLFKTPDPDFPMIEPLP